MRPVVRFVRLFSTAPAQPSPTAKLQEILSRRKPTEKVSVGLLENDTTKFTKAQVGGTYKLTAEESAKIFPEGFPGSRPHRNPLDEDGKPLFPQVQESRLVLPRHLETSDRHVLVREFSLSLTEEMDTLRAQPDKLADTKGFVLDGPAGVGKSLCLSHLIQHCRATGWVVVSLPRPKDWLTQSFQLVKVRGQPGFYDQPDMATPLLAAIKEGGGEKLASLPLKNLKNKDIPFGVGATLGDLIEWGLALEENACTAALHLRTELNLIKDCPVLIVVDEINHLFDDPVYEDIHGRILPEQLRLLTAWRAFPTRSASHTLMIGATSHASPTQRTLSAVQFAGGKNVRNMPDMTKAETQGFLQTLRYCSLLKNEPDVKLVEYAHTMSAGRPAEVERVIIGADSELF